MNKQDPLEEASSPLQPYYEKGDDADAVRMSLDAIAGILAAKSGEEDVDPHDGLAELLKELNAPKELVSNVRKLYGFAGGGRYGAGLSGREASKLNSLIEDWRDDIVEFVANYQR